MYVSGKILKEVIDGCRDQTIDFTNNKVIFGNATLTYYGNFHITNPEDRIMHKNLRKLINNQLNYYVFTIRNLIKSNSLDDTYNLVLEMILNIKEPYKIRLLGILNKLVLNPSINKLNRLMELINCLNNIPTTIKQVELESIIYFYFNTDKEFSYNDENIKIAEKMKYGINYDEYTKEENQIITLGEFIDYPRLITILKDIHNPEFRKYVAPIYLLFHNYRNNKRFLTLCKNNELTKEQILNNAYECEVPNTLLKLIKK